MNGTINYKHGEHFGIENLRCYDGLDGAVYYIGANNDLERLYSILEKRGGNIKPRYDVHPIMNMNRNYGLEIRKGKFAIVTAEILVERILKW